MMDGPVSAAVDSGDTAWMLAATALVLLMTPALGLFYAGLVRAKNTLNTFMMCVAAIAVATVTWALVGYSFAFDEGNGFIGGFGYAFLNDVTFEPREGRRSRTSCSWPSRRRSASSRSRWCRAPWSSGCASPPSSCSRRSGRCSSTPCSRTGPSAPAGCSRTGRSTSPAACRSRWGRASRRWRRRSSSGARKDYGRQALLPHNAVYVLLGRRPAVVRLVRLQRRQRVLHGQLRRPRVHEHAALPGLHARRLVHARRSCAAGRSPRSARPRRSSSAAC